MLKEIYPQVIFKVIHKINTGCLSSNILLQFFHFSTPPTITTNKNRIVR